MNDLVPVLVIGLITYGVYAIFELFIRKNERMAIIEKLSIGIDPAQLKHQVSLFKTKEKSSWAIRIGCLLVGVGLGVFIVAIVELAIGGAQDWSSPNFQAIKTMYPAAAALFGGIGLIIAYFIERKDKKETSK